MNSELTRYKAYLGQSLEFLSPAEHHVMVSAKAYELAFYRPFIPPSLQPEHLPLSEQASSQPSQSSSQPLIQFDFSSPPTIPQISHQSLDIYSSTEEFLMWTGFHIQSVPYHQQLQQFIGSNLIISWQYSISNIVTLIKHFYLTCNINFMFWVFQLKINFQ